MRIGFDAKRAYLNATGLGNYSRTLIRSLLEYYPENEYFLFSPVINGSRFQQDLEHHANVKFITAPKGLSPILHPVWRTLFAPVNFKNQKLDLYHGLSNELPLKLLDRKRTKTVVTIHDLIFLRYPELYPKIDAGIFKSKSKAACKSATQIVAVSEQTRRDLNEFYEVPLDQIKVVYQSCDPIYQRPCSDLELQHYRTFYQLPERYALYVGTIEERKNLLTIINAMSQQSESDRIPLVVVGRRKKYFDEVQSYITRYKLNNWVMVLDNVPKETLPALYQMATVFLYPSVFEGFGIPILEAITSGTPVITSINSCFEEAGGPGSLYLDPADDSAWATSMTALTQDQDRLERMRAVGFEYAKSFRPEVVSHQMMDIYQSLL
jgi:glycosyltransferase involved in cell wall biosynthesis